MKLRIPVSKWLHGEQDVKKEFPEFVEDPFAFHPGSMLYRPQDKKMCCIGLYLQACGVKDQDLYNIGEPCDVPVGLPEQARWLLTDEDAGESSVDAGSLMTENDGDANENKIAQIFAEHGVEVEFVHDES